MMKSILRRISALEQAICDRVDQERAPNPAPNVADLIRERRRRRLAAEGLPFKERPLRDADDFGDRPRTIAETIRALCFGKRGDE